MNKALLAIGMAIALGAAVVGCGGGDDDSTGATLTKAEFIAQADTICKDGEDALEQEADEFAEENDVDIENPTEAQQEEVISDVVAPAVRQQAEAIDGLGAPEGDEETVEAIVAAVESGADELESDPKLLLEGENPLGEGSELAREYGLKECGEE